MSSASTWRYGVMVLNTELSLRKLCDRSGLILTFFYFPATATGSPGHATHRLSAVSSSEPPSPSHTPLQDTQSQTRIAVSICFPLHYSPDDHQIISVSQTQTRTPVLNPLRHSPDDQAAYPSPNGHQVSPGINPKLSPSPSRV